MQNASANSFNVFKASGALAIKLDICCSTSVFVCVVVLSAFKSRPVCVAADTGLVASVVLLTVRS